MTTITVALAALAAWVASRRVARTTRLRPVRSRPAGTVRSGLGTWWAAVLGTAGVTTDPATVGVWWLGAIGAAATLGGAVDVRLGVLGALVAVGGGVAMLLAATARTRSAVVHALPGFVRTVASELRIGGTVVGAIERVASQPGPLTADCRRVATRLRLGAPVLTALSWWPTDRDVPDVRAVAGALAVAASVGGPAAEALDGLAASLSDRQAVVAEARAQSAQARSSAVVVVAAPLGYLVVAAVADQRAVDALFGSSLGLACLGMAVVLEILAVAWIRALLRRAAGEAAPR